MTKCNKFRKGFGILEVLVSSLIIITILMALVFVGRTALANSAYSQEKAQAVYVAQEGIEIVRQIRDTNWIDGDNTTGWNSLTSLAGTNNYKVNFSSSKYSLVLGSDSVTVNNMAFIRTIKIESVGSLLPGTGASTDVHPTDNALKVTSTVTWSFNNVQKSVSASEILTNWRPNF
ncbi:MAG: hypothetical protein M1324_00550 [Patescibacteria group bacterium]|nr:hypothetical protein [Patescibacteria group bacterium]